MLGDLFDTPDELLEGFKEGHVQTSWDRLPRCCADLLPLPEKERKSGYPIGLKNQGATCYLNSLLQLLFLTPELRAIMLELPLCEGSVDKPTKFTDNKQKQSFLLGFQRLFSEMALCDVNSLATSYLTAAFGWEGKEHMEQQDIQEAMRVIFDTICRALAGTVYEQKIKQLFRIEHTRFKQCRTCTVINDIVEESYDLALAVNYKASVEEAILGMLEVESMDGDNKIFCEVCTGKQDFWLGTKIKKVPNTLVVSLNRFAFDFEKMDRVKITDEVKFGLELDMSCYLEEAGAGAADIAYQLYGIIIHSGSAHGGHYYCYARDVLGETDWQKVFMETKKQEQDLAAKLTPESQLTKQQRERREELKKENQQKSLPEPANPALMQNWYCIDDAVCTAISAQKITTKFSGRECAYTLFYRRRGLVAADKHCPVPDYFSLPIKEQNQSLKATRSHYESQKQQIIVNVNGNNYKLAKATPVTQFLATVCTDAQCIVSESLLNDLPYYPAELNSLTHEYSAADTLQSLEVIHDSVWKTYDITGEDYARIKDSIGKEKIPFGLNLVCDGKASKIVMYGTNTLADFRKRIEAQKGVKYESQMLTLVTPYKETFLTDDLSKDDVLLTKLGFINDCQVVVRCLAPKEGATEEQPDGDSPLICFIVERDDIAGIKRLYFNRESTLKQLLTHVMSIEGIEGMRRFRNMNGNRLYYIDHYEQQLDKLNFQEEIVKLRIERGQIPIKGDVCIKVKLQSKLWTNEEIKEIEKIFDPSTTIKEVKAQMCEMIGLDPEAHKLYMTDWTHEPIRSLSRENMTLFEASFVKEETLCLRDLESPIGDELMYFEVYTTETGSCDNTSSESFSFKIENTKNVQEMKEGLLKKLEKPEVKTGQLRIREIRRDYTFGNIWRQSNKLVKDIPVNTNKIVLQILPHEEALTDAQIVLILKKRNHEKQVYEGTQEIIFQAGKAPTVNELIATVRAAIKVDDQVRVYKYFSSNFQWVKVSQQAMEKQIENDFKYREANRKDKKDKKGGKDSAETNKVEQPPNKQQTANKQEPLNKKEPKKPKKDQAEIMKMRQDQAKNLRKPPTMLKDGDWLGWALAADVTGFKDNMQTEQDLMLRKLKEKNKVTSNYKNRNEGKGFNINVGF